MFQKKPINDKIAVMVNSFSTKKQEKKIFLSLDVGTEAIKALVFEKNEGKIIILGQSLEYYDRFGIFDSRDFEIDIIKNAILKNIKNLAFLLSERGFKEESFYELPLAIGLSAKILKARIISQSKIREDAEKIINNQEELKIDQEIKEKAKKEFSQNFLKSAGILPEDLHFTSFKVLERKINGYRVSGLKGYGGKNIEFNILVVFLLKHYLKKFEEIFRSLGFKNFSFTHEIECLSVFLNEPSNSLFLDIGGEVTQIFRFRKGTLEQIDDFEIGGKFFTQAVMEKLGLSETLARDFKEKYIRREVSEETRERVGEIFRPKAQAWFQGLMAKLTKTKESSGKDNFNGSFLPPNIFIFGGGSLLPEIEEILKKGNRQHFSFATSFEIKFIYPKDFKNVEDGTNRLKSPQNIPSLLICCDKIFNSIE